MPILCGRKLQAVWELLLLHRLYLDLNLLCLPVVSFCKIGTDILYWCFEKMGTNLYTKVNFKINYWQNLFFVIYISYKENYDTT